MSICAIRSTSAAIRKQIVELILVSGATLLCAALVHAYSGMLPLPPQIFLDTTPVTSKGATHVVHAGGDLQAALNAAQPGDQILLEAGATFRGPFTVPVKSGSDWIVVRTSAPDSSLPPYGSRITPAWSSSLPKIVTTGTRAALLTAPGAHHFRFIGIEFAVADGVALNYGIVTLGDGSSAQRALSQVPYALVFDRVYVHGNSTGNMMRGFALNSASTAVVNSYVADIHAVGFDTQAIAGWNGPGPFKIANNSLEAAAENVLFGGSDPSILNLVPSDIEVRGNYMFKPLSWRQGSATYAGIPWSIKNIFELKNAQRVLVDGNVIEQNWPESQNGYSVLFTVRNQGGRAPWCVVADVTFTHNIVRHVANAVNILGWDDEHVSRQTNRVLIQDNLFEDVNASVWGGNGRLFLLGGPANVTIDHNTAFQSGDFITATGRPGGGFTFTNNIVPNNKYGLAGDGCYGHPIMCMSMFLPGASVRGNAIAGGSASLYPGGNFFPATLGAVGFVSLAGGDYQLGGASPYRNASIDGRDVGVDWNALIAATAGSVSGRDVMRPAISIAQPLAGASLFGTTTVSASAADSQSLLADVVLLADGSPIASFSAPPYQAAWNTSAVANGTHVISATATDVAGNQILAGAVTVTVANLVISSVATSNVTNNAATITWSTSPAADSQVQYGTTAAYGSMSGLSQTLVTGHTQTLNGLAASTTYHYRVLSRDANGSLASSPDYVFTTPAALITVSSAPVPVVWTTLVNVTASGNSLTKTSRCGGCGDAGAVSAQSISSGDGYLEFTIGELASERAVGLSHGNPGTTVDEIAFGLLVWPGGGVNVREGGLYRTGLSVQTGDRLRVSVTRGVVTYARNGSVFYTSRIAPVYPLVADVSILTPAGTVTNAVIAGAR